MIIKRARIHVGRRKWCACVGVLKRLIFSISICFVAFFFSVARSIFMSPVVFSLSGRSLCEQKILLFFLFSLRLPACLSKHSTEEPIYRQRFFSACIGSCKSIDKKIIRSYMDSFPSIFGGAVVSRCFLWRKCVFYILCVSRLPNRLMVFDQLLFG